MIESVVEDLDVKKQLFVELDRIVKDGAILATNTSTLPVVEMAVETGRPERVRRRPLLQPRPAMSLVEVVRTLLSSDETVAEAVAFAEACGKGPVVVEDRAGFIVNALLFPYLNNAVRMLENRTASRDDIDAAMKGGCGFPMGPLALLDLVGLDTSVAILDALYAEFRDPNYAAVPLLRRMVAAGQLGRKSGHGFYDYAEVAARSPRIRSRRPHPGANRGERHDDHDDASALDEAERGRRRARWRRWRASARRAGRKAVLTGRWLADTVVEVAPRLPVRDARHAVGPPRRG